MRLDPDVIGHYAQSGERERLDSGVGRLEELRTRELLDGWLPATPATVLDVGGGAGRYALPLAGRGYRVHLLDPVALHVGQAAAASAASEHPLTSAALGDARCLPFADAGADAVLLLGPLYHLVDRADRVQALREARRVVRPGGVVVAAAISRWASTADGFVRGYLTDPEFAGLVADGVRSGVHRNPGRRPGWFTTAYFHRPEELVDEVSLTGLTPDGPVAVEGLAGFAPDVEGLLADAEVRRRVLEALRRTEREPALLGASSHLLIAGRRS
jgi:SAM-dependent methyltransferase